MGVLPKRAVACTVRVLHYDNAIRAHWFFRKRNSHARAPTRRRPTRTVFVFRRRNDVRAWRTRGKTVVRCRHSLRRVKRWRLGDARNRLNPPDAAVAAECRRAHTNYRSSIARSDIVAKTWWLYTSWSVNTTRNRDKILILNINFFRFQNYLNRDLSAAVNGNIHMRIASSGRVVLGR